MNWQDVEQVYQVALADLVGQLDGVPKHTGPIVGGLAEKDEEDKDFYIKPPPVVAAEFDVKRLGPRPRLEISGSGMRALRSRPEDDVALGTTLTPMRFGPVEVEIVDGSNAAELLRVPPVKTKKNKGRGYRLIDYGLTLTLTLEAASSQRDFSKLRLVFTNTTNGASKKLTSLQNFEFVLKLVDCHVAVPDEVRNKNDVPLFIETVNAVAYPNSSLTEIRLSPIGLWDQPRITTNAGPTFEEAKITPFESANKLGSWAVSFEFAARITTQAMRREVNNDTFHKFQYDLRGRIFEQLVKCWEDGNPRAIVDNAPTAAGKSEPNFDAAAVASIALKHKTQDANVGTVAIITEPVRTLASEQLERLFRFVAYTNEQLPDNLKITMGFYMGTQEGRGIPKLPSSDVTIAQVPITTCPFCGNELRLNFEQKIRRLIPQCQSCTPHRSFPWIYLTISETEEFLPNVVVATLDKLCYEEGHNLGVHSFFGREFVLCSGCGRRWPVSARILNGSGNCWVCNTLLQAGDLHRSRFSLLIMDEAHVFRGSMGSNAGLFTSTELKLAARAIGKAPLVLASTATIKRARDLMLNLTGSREVDVLPLLGDEDSNYFTTTTERHRRFAFLCSNVSNRVAIPKTVASIKRAWDIQSSKRADGAFPKKLPQVVFTKKRQSAENLRNAIQVLGDEDRLDIRSEVIHGETTKPEIKARLREVENNEIDVLFVTIDLISLGLDIPSIQVIHFDGMPEDYAKFIQAYGRAARSPGTCGLIFVWLRMSMPGEAYYLERYRDLFLYKRDLMPVIPINKWFPQAIRTFVTPAALQYSFFTDQRGSIFNPTVAARKFSDSTFLKELEDFLVGGPLAGSDKPEDAEIATKYSRLGIQDLSSFMQNTPSAGKLNVQALLGEKLPRGIRSQAGETEVIPTNFSRELMSVRVERSLLSAGYTDTELGLGEE